MTATNLAGVAVAGALGAPCRYLLSRYLTRPDNTLAWGTFAVNVSGSLILGLVTGAGLYHAFPATPRIWLGTGFCGSYTTFSTFTAETIGLLEEGRAREGFAYLAASALAGTAAAGVGLGLTAIF